MTVLGKLLEYVRVMLPHWEIGAKEDISTPTYTFTCAQNDFVFDYILDKVSANVLKGKKNFKIKRIIQLAFLIAHNIENVKEKK